MQNIRFCPKNRGLRTTWEGHFFPQALVLISSPSLLSYSCERTFFIPLQNSPEAAFTQTKGAVHHTSQMNILSARESTLPTSLNFNEGGVQMQHRCSRTPNRTGRRDDQ